MDKQVSLILQDQEIDALLHANPKYKQHMLTYQNGKRLMYLELI